MCLRLTGASVLLCLFAAGGVAGGQPPIVFTGKVRDGSDSVVPGAAVRVRDLNGNAVQVITDPVGAFIVKLPSAATYTFVVDAAGFEPYTREGLNIESGAAAVNIVLAVASRAEQVTVTARAPDITESLEVRQVRESSARDLGEALVRVDGLWKVRKGAVSNDVVLRGFQQDNLNLLIDGVRIYGACPASMDPPASHVDFGEIQNVEVTKGPFDVCNQGSLGGLVNVVRKSPASGLRLNPARLAGKYTDQATVPNVDTIIGGVFADFRTTLAGSIHFSGGARLDSARSSPRIPNPGTDLYWARHPSPTRM